MCSRVFLFLTGAVYILYQVLATDVYIAELMVEGNVTLQAETVMSVFNTTTNLTVIDKDGIAHPVTISFSELVAECQIIGDQTSCKCYPGYVWSNTVCYNHSCCREMTCTQNVSDIVPLCVAKVKVRINGSVIMNTGMWSSVQTTQLETEFGKLNAFEYLNVTGHRLDNKVTDFEVAVSIKFDTFRLQVIVENLQTSLGAVLWVDTSGMVTIESPNTTVCYKSDPVLKCTFEEATDSAGWNMSRKYERFELNNGSVVELGYDCSTEVSEKSCVEVTLREVTGIWSGSYECGFTHQSVRHTAKAELNVALLPDVIVMKTNPLTVDCSGGHHIVPINVIATISNSTETFEVWWSYRGTGKNALPDYRSDGDNLVYAFNVDVSCTESIDAQYVNVTFKNTKDQVQSERVDIPVIYEGKTFCIEENVNGQYWPKTPAGDTVINTTCPEGRVGYKSRTCDGTTWKSVFPNCVDEELKKVLNAAENFRKGLGATQAVALDIFAGLKNSFTSDSFSDDDYSIADINAAISVLDVMASASKLIDLQDDVLPDFVNAASNMLNKTWGGVNRSIVEQMSSNYLHSVEELVQNIKFNKSNDLDTQNLQLKFCTSRDCNLSVFGIDVNLNKSTGVMKTVAVKNLMDKLKNNYVTKERTSLIVSTTLEDRHDPYLEIMKIKMQFPQEQLVPTKPFCVFWDTLKREWSNVGCTAQTSDGNRTVCECNHLTSFSVLMSKGDVSDKVLDIITNVGLGISVCSLLIFLIIEYLVWSAVVKSNLSHFRHTAIVNIAVFLLLANCSFLASTSPESLGDTWCLTLTVCKHLFYLAMFSWMLCMSVMLVHQLIFVFSPLRKRVFMFFSSIVGYICPILIVGSSYVYSKYTEKEYYNKKTCWLVYERLLEGSIHAFLLPIGTVILTNIFSMVVVILTLVKSSAPEGSKADDKETAKSIIKVLVFLTPVFGVTWIIGFALLLLKTSSPMYKVASYSFTILNSFQGLFILITGCFAEQKVREEMIRLITAKSKGKSESKTNLTTTYTKDK